MISLSQVSIFKCVVWSLIQLGNVRFNMRSRVAGEDDPASGLQAGTVYIRRLLFPNIAQHIARGLSLPHSQWLLVARATRKRRRFVPAWCDDVGRRD